MGAIDMNLTKPITFAVPEGVYAVSVVSVRHYTDRLFAFRTSRPAGLRFRSGEFVMIGLPNSERPIYRAYSIASPAWDEELEFFSIKVPGGPLTEHLQKIVPGDTILIKKKATGTLVNDALLPGKRLYMFATGTGIAPFASLIRDPETYEKFDQLVLTHTCRLKAELRYGEELVASLKDDPLIGEFASRLTYYASTTREDSQRMGRITTLITSGKLFADLGVPPLNPVTDRVMICGSMAMLKDVRVLAEEAGLAEGSNTEPGSFVVERAFVG
jgi:ferredoxin--NADP+ reductase